MGRGAGACVRSVQTVVRFFGQHFLRAGASPRKEGRVPFASRLPLLTSWRINKGHGITSAQLALGRESGAQPPNIHSWSPTIPWGMYAALRRLQQSPAPTAGSKGPQDKGRACHSCDPRASTPAPARPTGMAGARVDGRSGALVPSCDPRPGEARRLEFRGVRPPSRPAGGVSSG